MMGVILFGLASRIAATQIAGLTNPSFEVTSGSTYDQPPAGWASLTYGNLVVHSTSVSSGVMPTHADRFLWMYTRDNYTFFPGDFITVFQVVDLSSDYLTFDWQFPPHYYTELRMLIDGLVVWTRQTAGNRNGETIDVSDYNGPHEIGFQLYVHTGGTFLQESAHIDNVLHSIPFDNSSFETWGGSVEGWIETGQPAVTGQITAFTGSIMPTEGNRYLQLATYNNFTYSLGDYRTYSQTVDLTDIASLAFDYHVRNGVHTVGRVLVDETVIWERPSEGFGLNETIDLSSYSGLHTIGLQEYVDVAGTFTSEYVYFDNIRLMGYSIADFDTSGDVNMVDFAIFASAWLTEPGDAQWNPKCDTATPTDSYIDMQDLAVVVGCWLE